jgi:hypothetical protein
MLSKTAKSEKTSEPVYRFLTPDCEVQMSVQHFDSFLTKSFRFRDLMTNRGFCLSANGEEDRGCLERFSGSIAIAPYHLRSRLHSSTPFHLRERVLTIDHDSRMNARPPFERTITAEGQVVSDIQAFGYNKDDTEQAKANSKPITLWCLLRQDLYLNEQTKAFLIVHWKHTLSYIDLLDVIPGDQTEVIAGR